MSEFAAAAARASGTAPPTEKPAPKPAPFKTPKVECTFQTRLRPDTALPENLETTKEPAAPAIRFGATIPADSELDPQLRGCDPLSSSSRSSLGRSLFGSSSDAGRRKSGRRSTSLPPKATPGPNTGNFADDMAAFAAATAGGSSRGATRPSAKSAPPTPPPVKKTNLVECTFETHLRPDIALPSEPGGGAEPAPAVRITGERRPSGSKTVDEPSKPLSMLQKFGARHNREQRRSSSVPARAPENFASPDGGGDDDVVIEVKDLDTGETHKVRLATTSGIVVTGGLAKDTASSLARGRAATGSNEGTNHDVEQEDRTLFGFRAGATEPAKKPQRSRSFLQRALFG